MEIQLFAAELGNKNAPWEDVHRWLAAMCSAVDAQTGNAAFLAYQITHSGSRKTVFEVLCSHTLKATRVRLTCVVRAFELLHLGSLLRDVTVLKAASTQYRQVLQDCMNHCPEADASLAAVRTALEVQGYFETLAHGASCAFYEGVFNVLLPAIRNGHMDYMHISRAVAVMAFKSDDRIKACTFWDTLIAMLISAMHDLSAAELSPVCSVLVSLTPLVPIVEGVMETLLLRCLNSTDHVALLETVVLLTSYPSYAFRLQALFTFALPPLVRKDPDTNALVVAPVLNARVLLSSPDAEAVDVLSRSLRSLSPTQNQEFAANCAKFLTQLP
eukprot:TRINITY_DN24440_c0_g1_i1.p1 TRINITY_DN24440_c0_g1~~TRINITY_DN24440_c0_g1_i1.p1  ORF type:complete len:329 (+),score=44.15 TRINITY_DN24440_c0_g1_i1:36-1022(+)